jgi:hypothetical protein
MTERLKGAVKQAGTQGARVVVEGTVAMVKAVDRLQELWPPLRQKARRVVREGAAEVERGRRGVREGAAGGEPRRGVEAREGVEGEARVSGRKGVPASAPVPRRATQKAKRKRKSKHR